MQQHFDLATCAGRVANHFAQRQPRDAEEFLDRVGKEDKKARFVHNDSHAVIAVRFRDGSVLECSGTGPWRVLTAQ